MDRVEQKIESQPEPIIFELYMKFQLWKPGPFLIVLLWFCVILMGVFYGFDILNLTVFTFDAPDGTEGHTADVNMKKQFPRQINERQLILYYGCDSCKKDGTQIFKKYMNCSVNDQPVGMQTVLFCMSANMQVWLKEQNVFLNYSDFTTIYALDPTNKLLVALAATIYISPNNKSAVGLLEYDNRKPQQTKNDFIDNLDDECTKISKQYGNNDIVVSMTGESALVKDMNSESRTDVERKDTLTIPLALCVLAFIIRSWRLMFIPLICFGTSICASFSIMRPFAEHVLDVNPFCPSIMMSVTIAMSIDYTLFLLSRFREEVERNMRPSTTREGVIKIVQEAVRQTTRWSGKVIALSGCILSITYFALIFYPMEVLQSVGLGAGLAIICTILVNLTLTPAVILIFPFFFSKFGWEGCPCKRERGNSCLSDPLLNEEVNREHSINNSSAADRYLVIEDPISNRVSNPSAQNVEIVDLRVNIKENDCCERFWYKCGSKTTVCPWNILIILFVYAAISPIGWQFLSFKKQLSDILIFPRDSDHLTTYNDVVDDFSAGYVAPWYILIYTKDEQTGVMSNSYINETGLMMQEFFFLCKDKDYDVTIDGVAFFGSEINGVAKETPLTLNFINYKIMNNATLRPVYELAIYNKISETGLSSYYGMTSSFDPFYEHAIDFVSDARDYLKLVCDKYGYSLNGCYLAGGSVDEVDSVNKIYSNFGPVLGIIVAVIFSLMGFVFKSVFVPFRLFITIAVPMTFVYGLAIMTYQNGMLSSLNMDAVDNTDGLYWIIPVMTVTILIGLALDYDIFLFARIYEYRVMGGVPTQQAILRGVYKTGSIITAAGLIMGIAFCGLLMSKITSLNQTGFIMVIAVLVDTFVIRTSLVPAVLSIAKEVNWWPGLNPTCHKESTTQMELDSNNQIQNNRPLKTSEQYNESTLDNNM